MYRTLVVSLLAVVCCGGMWAQAGAGSGAVSGTVMEAAGDGLPDATVTLSNSALGLTRVMNTTDDGLFTAPALSPAAGYRLKISHKGFTDWESKDFEVSIGQTVDFHVTMQHQAEDSQSGPTPPPRVTELTAGMSNLIRRLQVDELPAQGHRADPLVLTTPLASTDDRTGQIILAGQPSSNVFLQDGILTTNTYYQERRSIAPQLSLDSVHEMQVLTANYPAEFGDAMGGVVNTATRSGYENYHGTGYEYLTPSGLGAASRYGLGHELLQRQNQFGASVGGPIVSNKVFFFANGEVFDGRADTFNRITTPVLTDPFGLTIPAANCTATAAQCAAAIKFIQSQMNVPVTLTARSVEGLGRIDYRRSDRNQFTFEGNVMNGRSPNGGPFDILPPNGGLLGLQNSSEQIRYGKAGWTSAPTPSSVNELRFGLFEDRLSDPSTQSPLATTNAAITVAGAIVGNPHPNADALSERREQFVDNWTATSSTHTLRLGADVSQTRDTVSGLNGPTYVYPSLTTFAEDFTTGGTHYTYYTQELGDAIHKVPSRQYNLYAMDTWRPFRQLMIVAGVRWERQRREQPAVANPNYYQTATIANPVIDFAPRISFAYQADDRTVLRFGYGWFYDPMPGRLLDALLLGGAQQVSDIVVSPGHAGAPVFPNVLPPTSAIPAGTTNLMFAASKLRDPHIQQYNVSIERDLGSGTTLTISGIRDRGFKLWSVSDINTPVPTLSKTYAIDNAAGQQTSTYSTFIYNTRNDPNYAHIWDVDNGAGSWYYAASAELRKRMVHGFSVQASYTWSHNIDENGGPAIAGFLPLNLNNGDVAGDKTNSPIDQRNRVSLNWVWQPVVHGAGSPAMRRFVNGWEISGIATLASGHPVTPTVIVNGQQFSGTTMLYPSTLNGSGGWNRVPFDPLGSLHTPSQYNLNARISRTIDFTERVKGIVLFEAFNALNNQFITGINTVAYTATPTTPPNGTVNGPFTGILHPANGTGTGNVASPARQAQVAFRVVF